MKKIVQILLSYTHNILLRFMSSFNREFSEWITVWVVNMIIFINALTIIKFLRKFNMFKEGSNDALSYLLFFSIGIFIYRIYLVKKKYVKVNLKYAKEQLWSKGVILTFIYYIFSIYFLWN